MKRLISLAGVFAVFVAFAATSGPAFATTGHCRTTPPGGVCAGGSGSSGGGSGGSENCVFTNGTGFFALQGGGGSPGGGSGGRTTSDACG
jgi:hypothetical protein